MGVIVFHPSLITYDYRKVFTWEQYQKRKKKNLNVKQFRESIGYKDPVEEMLGKPGDFGAGKTLNRLLLKYGMPGDEQLNE